MKSIYTLILACTALYASAQSGFNYQAVARNNAGNILANQQVGVRLTITDGTTTLYSETQTPTTNQFGLFDVTVGAGTAVTGTFAGIDWTSTERYMKVEADFAGGTNYADMGTTRLQSVPFAKNAEKVGLYNSGTNNTERTIVQHSPAYPAYGLFYNDATDQFRFNGQYQGTLTVGVDGKPRVGVNTTVLDTNANLQVVGTARVRTTDSAYVQVTPTEVNRQRTGNANLIPIAYGNVGANGSVFADGSTSNFTAAKTATGVYEITINGESYYYQDYTTLATINSTSSVGFIGTNSGSNKLLIRTYDTAGALADRPFNFIIYKP